MAWIKKQLCRWRRHGVGDMQIQVNLLRPTQQRAVCRKCGCVRVST